MLESLYYIFTVTIVVILVVGFRYVLNKTDLDGKTKQKRLKTLVVGLFLWFAYMFVLSYTGVLKNFVFPPRFPILLMIPAFVFVFVFLKKNKKSIIIDAIPNHFPVLFESFRIPVELLLHGTFLAGLIPIHTTYSGYNFEIYFAATALGLGVLVYKKVISNKFVLIWNFIGLGFLLTILLIFMTCVFYPQFWGETKPMVSLDLGTLPYMIVPGFYVPVAVFMHVLSIVKLTKK